MHFVKRRASVGDDFSHLRYFVLFPKFTFPHFDDLVTLILQLNGGLERFLEFFVALFAPTPVLAISCDLTLMAVHETPLILAYRVGIWIPAVDEIFTDSFSRVSREIPVAGIPSGNYREIPS